MKLAVCIAIALAGCGGRSKESCRADADALAKLLASTDHEPPTLFVRGVKLVERTDLTRSELQDAPVIRASIDAIVFRDATVDPGDLRARLSATRREYDDEMARHPIQGVDVARIYFMIDAGTPWSRVAAIVGDADAAGFGHPAFVFARPLGASPPPRAPIDDELDAIASGDPANHISKLAEVTRRVIDGCPAMIQVFGNVAATEGGSKADALIAGIAPALVECNCNLDVPAFRSVMWHMLVNEHPTSTLAVTIDPSAAPIELPGITSWREASKRLTRDTTATSFRVQR